MSAPTPPASSHHLIKYGVVAIIIAALAIGMYIFVALSWSYSSGERAGFVQKLSKKGWLCKTWEGEMALVSLPGTSAEKFEFTVRDDAVAERINKQVGTRVALTYEQHKGLLNSCFGDTEYFVTDITPVQP